MEQEAIQKDVLLQNSLDASMKFTSFLFTKNLVPGQLPEEDPLDFTLPLIDQPKIIVGMEEKPQYVLCEKMSQ